jgi:hypothetical protein
MSAYQLTGEPWIYRTADQARIHPDHPDYQDYLVWLDAGNTPLPPSHEQLAEVREHMQCSDVQGLLAIDQAGYAAQYEAWASDPARTFAEKAFMRSTLWRRLDPILCAAAASWGLADEQVDDLFRLAVTL